MATGWKIRCALPVSDTLTPDMALRASLQEDHFCSGYFQCYVNGREATTFGKVVKGHQKRIWENYRDPMQVLCAFLLSTLVQVEMGSICPRAM